MHTTFWRRIAGRLVPHARRLAGWRLGWPSGQWRRAASPDLAEIEYRHELIARFGKAD